MNSLEIPRENLVRIVIPYKDIYTTVYLMKAPDGLVMFDTASSDGDMDEYVLPVMKSLGMDLQDLRYIFISHNHRDHARGLHRITEAAPGAMIVSRCPQLKEQYGSRVFVPEDGTVLLDVFQVVTIPGHTADSAALLDTRTDLLVTGDCLQLYGIYGSGQWGANITLPAEHLLAVEKVRQMQVDSIFCAHTYHPCGHMAEGRAAVERMLDACIEPLLRLRDLLLVTPEADDEAICARYHENVCLPTVAEKVVAAMRSAIQEGRIAP